jgi:hypothetical protein
MKRYTHVFAVTRPEMIWSGKGSQLMGFLSNIKALLSDGAKACHGPRSAQRAGASDVR